MDATDFLAPATEAMGRLRRYLGTVTGVQMPPLSVRPLTGGMSRPSFRLTADSCAMSWVLRTAVSRREVAGLLREYRALRTLRGSPVRAPAPVAVCEDASVLGTAFSVLEWVEGTVHTRKPTGLSAEQARKLSLAVVETLCSLHRLPPRHHRALPRSPDPARYLERQMERLRRQCLAFGSECPRGAVGLLDVLAASLPRSPEATVVHGDFHPGNLVFDAHDPARPAAILDWELCTVGDPLTDLGTLAACWSGPADPPNSLARGLSGQPGLLNVDELVDRYVELTGAAGDRTDWYLVFGQVRTAVLLQALALNGQTLREPSPQALVDRARQRVLQSRQPGLQGETPQD
ncbi:phosphotransferase family protein [Streptomyces sp. NPDC054796]